MDMDCDRTIELMEIEMECIKRANTCDRNCAKCELVQKDTDLLEAYNMAIACITYVKNDLERIKKKGENNE